MLEKSLDKLTLNTEIVSMRHATRRARLHVINKLVREARKLRTKKGTDEQKKKYQRKADRLTEEVFIIKKLKDDNISKTALMNTQALEEVISDPAVTLETRALARLANHHHLKLRVNEFRTKYPTWKETLSQLLPQLGAKRKKKGKEKIKKKVAESPEIKSNDHSNSVSNNDKENNSTLEQNIARKCKVNSEKIEKSRKTSKEDPSFNQNDRVADTEEDHKSQRHCGIGEVKRFTELLKEVNSENSDIESNIVSESPAIVEPSKSDPFFLHADDVSGDDDSHVDERMQDNKEIVVKKKKNKEESWGKFKQMGPNRRQRRQHIFGSKPSSGGFRSFQHKPSKGFASRKNEHTLVLGKNKEQHGALQGNEAAVHPSWEAKRKLKEQQQAIFAFQGKKIKFDDE